MPSSNTPERMTEEELRLLEIEVRDWAYSAECFGDDGDAGSASDASKTHAALFKAHALLSDPRAVTLTEEEREAMERLSDPNEESRSLCVASRLARDRATVQRFLARTTPTTEQPST